MSGSRGDALHTYLHYSQTSSPPPPLVTQHGGSSSSSGGSDKGNACLAVAAAVIVVDDGNDDAPSMPCFESSNTEDRPPPPPAHDYPLGCEAELRDREFAKLAQESRYWDTVMEEMFAVPRRLVRVCRHLGDYTFVQCCDVAGYERLGCTLYRACLSEPVVKTTRYFCHMQHPVVVAATADDGDDDGDATAAAATAATTTTGAGAATTTRETEEAGTMAGHTRGSSRTSRRDRNDNDDNDGDEDYRCCCDDDDDKANGDGGDATAATHAAAAARLDVDGTTRDHDAAYSDSDEEADGGAAAAAAAEASSCTMATSCDAPHYHSSTSGNVSSHPSSSNGNHDNATAARQHHHHVPGAGVDGVVQHIRHGTHGGVSVPLFAVDHTPPLLPSSASFAVSPAWPPRDRRASSSDGGGGGGTTVASAAAAAGMTGNADDTRTLTIHAVNSAAAAAASPSSNDDASVVHHYPHYAPLRRSHATASAASHDDGDHDHDDGNSTSVGGSGLRSSGSARRRASGSAGRGGGCGSSSVEATVPVLRRLSASGRQQLMQQQQQQQQQQQDEQRQLPQAQSPPHSSAATCTATAAAPSMRASDDGNATVNALDYDVSASSHSSVAPSLPALATQHRASAHDTSNNNNNNNNSNNNKSDDDDAKRAQLQRRRRFAVAMCKGTLALREHHYGKALRCYNAALREAPEEEARVRSSRSVAYLFLQQMELAMHDAQRVMQLLPHSFLGYVRAGNVLRSMRYLTDAQACFREALKRDPHNPVVRTLLLSNSVAMLYDVRLRRCAKMRIVFSASLDQAVAVARQAACAGDLLLKERTSLAAALCGDDGRGAQHQHHRRPRVCAHCFAPLVRVDDVCRGNRDVLRVEVMRTLHTDPTPVPCSYACGCLYCGDDCRSRAWADYHWVQCAVHGHWHAGMAALHNYLRAYVRAHRRRRRRPTAPQAQPRLASEESSTSSSDGSSSDNSGSSDSNSNSDTSTHAVTTTMTSTPQPCGDGSGDALRTMHGAAASESPVVRVACVRIALRMLCRMLSCSWALPDAVRMYDWLRIRPDVVAQRARVAEQLLRPAYDVLSQCFSAKERAWVRYDVFVRCYEAAKSNALLLTLSVWGNVRLRAESHVMFVHDHDGDDKSSHDRADAASARDDDGDDESGAHTTATTRRVPLAAATCLQHVLHAPHKGLPGTYTTCLCLFELFAATLPFPTQDAMPTSNNNNVAVATPPPVSTTTTTTTTTATTAATTRAKQSTAQATTATTTTATTAATPRANVEVVSSVVSHASVQVRVTTDVAKGERYVAAVPATRVGAAHATSDAATARHHKT